MDRPLRGDSYKGRLAFPANLGTNHVFLARLIDYQCYGFAQGFMMNRGILRLSPGKLWSTRIDREKPDPPLFIGPLLLCDENRMPTALARASPYGAQLDIKPGLFESTGEYLVSPCRPDCDDALGSQCLVYMFQTRQRVKPFVVGMSHRLGAIIDIEQDRIVFT